MPTKVWIVLVFVVMSTNLIQLHKTKWNYSRTSLQKSLVEQGNETVYDGCYRQDDVFIGSLIFEFSTVGDDGVCIGWDTQRNLSFSANYKRYISPKVKLHCFVSVFQQPLLRSILSRSMETFHPLYSSLHDQFELCLAKCRTSSQVCKSSVACFVIIMWLLHINVPSMLCVHWLQSW